MGAGATAPTCLIVGMTGKEPTTPPTMLTIMIYFAMLAYVSFLLYAWRSKSRLTSVMREAKTAIAAHDDDDDYECEVEVVAVGDDVLAGAGALHEVAPTPQAVDGAPLLILPKIGTPNYFRFAAKVAHTVKCKMGLPKTSEANRMVAVELVSKELLARNVRKCDVHRFQSVAVDLVFMPTKYDLLASQLRVSRSYKERLVEMQAGSIRSWEEWIRGCNPFRSWESEVGMSAGLRYSRG